MTLRILKQLQTKNFKEVHLITLYYLHDRITSLEARPLKSLQDYKNRKNEVSII